MKKPILLVVAAALAGCPEAIPATPRMRPPQGALASSRLSSEKPPLDVLTVPRPAEPEWFGLYLVGKKAGWTKVQVTRERRGGRDVLVARSDTALSATVGGKSVQRVQREERVYEAKAGGRLLTFHAEWSGDGGSRSLDGSCQPSGCRAVLSQDGTEQVKDLPADPETADQADGVRLAAARRTTIRGPQLDLDKLRIRTVEDVFLRREKIAGAGVETEVSVVQESEVGDRLATEYKLADDGRVVEIKLGDAIVAKPEGEATAKRLDKVDLFALSRVPVPRELSHAVPLTIVYRVEGLPRTFQKGDGRQSFAAGGGAVTVVTVRARVPAAADPGRDTPRSRVQASPEDLEPTPQIDSDDPEIRALAKEVAGDVPGTYAAALKLSEHVYRRLEKAYGASQDRASDVLRTGKGDCTEHSVLLLALARALGIPARGVHGLVYARYDDGVPALYWHAWVEVKSAGEWIPLDPTFGQPVADATHVALGTGAQVDTVGLLGALRVVGVDVKP
ncbi:MAG TPA: transglutaminase family protein [Anaeromyxobacteraceae bacterium]|nr:transglutaminase family protein [Anaeromyxobacteraceae bacterium]